MLPRLAVCFVLLKIVCVISAPIDLPHTGNETLDCNGEHSDVYDQRQNGTENYRIHVNGVVVLVAPAETVLQAAQLSETDLASLSESSTAGTPVLKPKPKPPSPGVVPSQSSSTDSHSSTQKEQNKDKNNLLNLLHMFRSIKHEADHHPQRHFPTN